MGSYFQIRTAERTAWFTSQEVRNIAEAAAMVTKAMVAVGEGGEASIRRLAAHAGIPLWPISAEQFTRQVRCLPDLPEKTLVTELDIRDDTVYCATWDPREARCVVVSGMLSRLMGIYELSEKSGKLDMDAFSTGVYEHLQVDFVDVQNESQSERWGLPDTPETRRGAVLQRVAALIATYEELLQIPEKACVTHYCEDWGVYVFKYNASHEQIQNAYEKALELMEMDSERFQAERQFISHGGIISAMRDRLLAKELKPGETVLFVGTEPYGGPGDFDLRGGVVESVDPSERTCSVRGEFFTMHDVPLHYVLGRYDTSVEGEHYGFPHVRPLFGENRELADQYLREAEASWNAQQAETQTDATQLMM